MNALRVSGVTTVINRVASTVTKATNQYVTSQLGSVPNVHLAIGAVTVTVFVQNFVILVIEKLVNVVLVKAR